MRHKRGKAVTFSPIRIHYQCILLFMGQFWDLLLWVSLLSDETFVVFVTEHSLLVGQCVHTS